VERAFAGEGEGDARPTGIGQSVAIHHTTTDAVGEALVVVGDSICWPAVDGAPVRPVCLLIAPKSAPGTTFKGLKAVIRRIRGDQA
jgi:mannitol/fructose-specific phosphotransferase system IIA component (Ntr-type)